jgi:hypothetical protein
LTENTEFKESIIVKGSILGKSGLRFNLRVVGNINARDINARDIDAWDINALGINARDINARNINARDINAYFIVCEILKQKEDSKLFATNLIEHRSTLSQHEIKRKVK